MKWLRNANEATKNLADAKTTHKALKMLIPEKSKAAAKPHHDNIDKHHATATTHAKALTVELKKSKPDNAKVKEHAIKLSEAPEKAEKEHKALTEKTK